MFAHKIDLIINLESILIFHRFMRSVAYREFIHLVYGRVGKNRIPLPACAYHAIRSKFLSKEKGDDFVGFVHEDMED